MDNLDLQKIFNERTLWFTIVLTFLTNLIS
jgi:hypothetical protein